VPRALRPKRCSDSLWLVPRSPRALFVVLSLFALGCTDERAAWRERASRSLADADARAAAVELASGAPSLPKPTRDLSRVLITTGHVVLDLAPRMRAHEPPPGSAPSAFEQASLPAPLEIGVVVEGHLRLPGAVSRSGHDTGRPLGDALEDTPLRRSDLHDVAVLAEGRASALVVQQALATLAEVGTSSAELVLARGRGRVAARLAVRRTEVVAGGHVEVAQHDDIAVELAAVDGGIAIRGIGGTLSPGCHTIGARTAIAVPNVGGHVDARGLAACVRAIREEVPTLRDLFVRADGLDVTALAAELGAIREGVGGASIDVVLVPAALAQPTSVMDHVLSGALHGDGAALMLRSGS